MKPPSRALYHPPDDAVMAMADPPWGDWTTRTIAAHMLAVGPRTWRGFVLTPQSSTVTAHRLRLLGFEATAREDRVLVLLPEAAARLWEVDA